MRQSTATAFASMFSSAFPNTYVLLAIRRKNKDGVFMGPFVKDAIRVNDLAEYLIAFKPSKHDDVYVTGGTYQGGFRQRGNEKSLVHHRKYKHLVSINHIVIDIDIHDDTISDQNRDRLLDAFVNRVNDAVRQGTLPPYHACNHTGRGLQFWYTIRPLAAQKCRFLFDLAVQALIELYTELRTDKVFGAFDALSVDSGASKKITGLYRLPGTYNTHAHRMSRLSVTPNYVVPSIDELLAHLGLERHSNDSLNARDSETQKNHGNQHIYTVTAGGSRQQPRYMPLNVYRRDLLEWMLKNEKIDVGRRNCLCFLYYNALVQIFGADKKLATQALLRFNAALSCPLPHQELIHIKQNIDNNEDRQGNKVGYYRFKGKSFLHFGGITAEEREMFDMAYKPPSILKREAEREARRAKKAERDDKIRELALSGKSYTEIEHELGIARNTIAKVIAPNRAINAQKIKKEAQLRQIAADLEAGKTWEEIAQNIGISMRTVARRVAELRKKHDSM